MNIADLGDVALHYREDGDPDGAPVLFIVSVATTNRDFPSVRTRFGYDSVLAEA